MRVLKCDGSDLTSTSSSSKPRIVCYHQTHYHDGKYVSILPLITHKTGATHVIVAAIHLNQPAGNITLNDDPYKATKYDLLWAETRKLQESGIKVLGMLGGAHQGSFSALDGEMSSFNAHYEPLREMIAWMALDGLDLDVEEAMSIAAVIRLIDHLKADFGTEFLITLAPVATAMRAQQNLSGFDYEVLEKAFGHKIAWYNTQFYCGWGCMRSTLDYEKIAIRWPVEKIVVGLVTNPRNCSGWVEDKLLRSTLTALLEKYPKLGGVMGWEYFNSITSEHPQEGEPWRWACFISEIFHSSRFSKSITVEKEA
ncbi:hypothetical protein MMC26_000035 [Xylographa opegraphella]|nr:hypothetical protein [Xylographa opegraphella]